MSVSALLRTAGLTKHFGGTQALTDVDFDVVPGEIHALLGENGAGKSTLIKIVNGVYEADRGEVWWRDEQVRHVRQLPISVIHQDLGLIEPLTVAENVGLVVGFPKAGGLIRWRALERQTQDLLDRVGCSVSPQRTVRSLGAAEKSLVAIARTLALQAEVIFLDEPTATLPHSDAERLFASLRRLREAGTGIVYVTHRLDEVFALADRVTVLRNGRNVATLPARGLSRREVVRLITGHDLVERYVQARAARGDAVLRVDKLVADGVGPVSLSVNRGEIVGLVGLIGAGHEQVGRVVFGLLRSRRGSLELEGKPLAPGRTRQAVRRRIGFVSSRRGEESLAPTLTVRENLYLNPSLDGGRELRLVSRRRERARANALIRTFGVQPQSCGERLVTGLSGGNQQKVVLARWLESPRAMLVLEEPTMGVDVGAKVEIYDLLARSAVNGTAVLVVSSDFEEVTRICDRALVFSRGRVIAEIGRGALSVERLTSLALADPEDARQAGTAA
jgi:ribose transport system ATP-binding protein